jgi:hypothetical protein
VQIVDEAKFFQYLGPHPGVLGSHREFVGAAEAYEQLIRYVLSQPAWSTLDRVRSALGHLEPRAAGRRRGYLL